MRTREDFHRLIDEIKDEQVLKIYFDLVKQLNGGKDGQLSDEEKQELLLSYEESLDPKNLISHEQVKSQHDKWLKK